MIKLIHLIILRIGILAGIIRQNPKWITNEKSIGYSVMWLLIVALVIALAYPGGTLASCDNVKSCAMTGPGFVGKPINLLTGEESFRRYDLTVGSFFPISIERRYSSRLKYDGPMGYGWIGNYDMWLVSNMDGTIDIYRDNVKKHYTLNNNVYISPSNDSGVLTKNLNSYIYTGKDGSKEEYDSFGRLAALVNLNGSSIVFTYETSSSSPSGYLLTKIEEKDSAGALTGKWITFSYNSGRLTQISDNLGRSVSYERDNSNNLVSVTSPFLTTTYGYGDPNGAHLMTSILEGEAAYTNTYDSQGRVIRQTHGTGIIDIEYLIPLKQTKVTTTIKDPAGNILNVQTRVSEFSGRWPVQVVDTFGNETRYSRNIFGQITSEEHRDSSGALKYVEINTYDNKGNLLTKKEGAGSDVEKITTYTYHPIFNKVLTETVKSVVNSGQNKVTTYAYDTKGNATSITETGFLGDGSPYSYTTNFEYNTNSRITKIDGPRTDVQDVTDFAYDSNGNLLSTTQPLIGATIYEGHDGYGNPGSITDPNGNKTSYTYDASGRVLTMKAPGDSAATVYTYATIGCSSCGGGGGDKIKTITFPEGNVIDYSYDPYGNLSKITDSAGNSINYTYDSEGNRLTEDIKDSGGALQKALLYQYDALNRLKKVVNPDNAYTEYTYDSMGNRVALCNPNTMSTQYAYDALNRLNSVIQPGNTRTSYIYDSNNNLTKVTDAGNNATNYKYDDMGRVYQVISPDTGTTAYGYDAVGNMISKTDAKGVTITYNYDALNRLVKIDFPTDTDITYTYDTCVNGKGRLCGMTDASGTTNYEYSPKGQITKETKVINGVTYVTGYTYDMNSNVKTITYPGERVITYNYLNNNIIAMQSNAQTLASSITYKPFGRMAGITYGNNITRIIGYDNRYHIRSIQMGLMQDLSYAYDANGNITGITDNINNSKNKTYSYDALERLTEAKGTWGTVNYTYDGVGNRQTETTDTGITNYTYNANKLASGTGAKAYSFTYDANGNTITENTRQYIYNQNQRLIKITDNNVTKGEYTYNANGQRAIKTAGTTTVYHYDLNGQLIAESTIGGTIATEYIYLNGQPLVKIDAGGMSYIHTDHLGTPVMMTNASGLKIWEIESMPFGDNPTIAGTAKLNIRFPGQYYDAETGLHYNYFRDYKPDVGRYVEADPIGIDRVRNHLYLYVGNSPLRITDSKGLYEEDVHFYRTFDWAIKAGIEPRIAMQIATSNQRVDPFLLTRPTIWPINWLFGLSFHFQTREYALVGLEQSLAQCNISQFGKFLHVMQDTFSHKGYGFPLGHARDSLRGRSPDIYCESNKRDIQMRNATEYWLNEFENKCGKKFHPVLRSTR